MTPTQFEVKKDEALPTVTPDKPFDDILKDSNGNIISQPEPIVNTEAKIILTNQIWMKQNIAYLQPRLSMKKESSHTIKKKGVSCQ